MDPTSGFAHAYPSAARRAKQRASLRARSLFKRLTAAFLLVLTVLQLPTLCR
jgi:hypothetical protein